MANPKRKGKGSTVGGKNLRFRATYRAKHHQHTTLSDVEDANDLQFWNKVTQDAATKAINENKAMNIPLTLLEDGWVVQKSQDGTTTRITKIHDQAFNLNHLTKGSILHVK